VTTTDKPVKRETRATVKGRPLIITLYPSWLEVREKGRRWRYTIDYQCLYQVAAKLFAAEKQREKAAKKRGLPGKP